MTPAERLAQLEAGGNPLAVCRLRSGFVVMSESQFLPGYVLFLASPLVGQLNDLTGVTRLEFLSDMARVGEAVMAATGCKRINYGIYGNVDPFLHVHVVPRYEWEETPYASVPPLSIPDSIRSAEAHRFDKAKHGALQERLRVLLTGD
ncbi:MAG TPA: hypothetical protein VG944_22380 [Fimbriimonas sp.]|nr:hypothetical protein [Fimbriimonas sp.]